MTPQLKKRILENCQGYNVRIVYEDEIFGKASLLFAEYQTEENMDNTIRLVTRKSAITLDFDNIVRIYVDMPREKRVELIEKSNSLEEALTYCQLKISDDEQVALEELQLKLFPERVEQHLQWLRNQIKACEPHFNAVEQVLSNLLLNMLGKEKIDTASDFKRLRQITKNDIKKIIKEMREIF